MTARSARSIPTPLQTTGLSTLITVTMETNISRIHPLRIVKQDNSIARPKSIKRHLFCDVDGFQVYHHFLCYYQSLYQRPLLCLPFLPDGTKCRPSHLIKPFISGLNEINHAYIVSEIVSKSFTGWLGCKGTSGMFLHPCNLWVQKVQFLDYR